jgi:hypothetical protein
MEPVDLARKGEDGLAAERDDDGPRRQAAQLARAHELERQLALVDTELRIRERPPHQRQRVERPEEPDVPEVAGEEELRPCGAAFLVVGPLHLVEHERVTRARGHLDGAAEDRRVLVDPLLTRDEPDLLLAEERREAPVSLLREHPQRPRVDAATSIREEHERFVRLSRVRRPQVCDHRLGRRPPRGEPDLDAVLRASHRRALVRALRAGMTCRARRAARRARAARARHRATVASAPAPKLRP